MKIGRVKVRVKLIKSLHNGTHNDYKFLEKSSKVHAMTYLHAWPNMLIVYLFITKRLHYNMT